MAGLSAAWPARASVRGRTAICEGFLGLSQAVDAFRTSIGMMGGTGVAWQGGEHACDSIHINRLQQDPMKTGTIVFDGIEYPDGNSSDPNALGWMQGSPPPAANRIRFEDDRYLEFPQIRWSLSHMRELVPTVAVWRGAGTPSDIGIAARAGEAQIDAMMFADLRGTQLTWAGSLSPTYTDGLIVLHRGNRVYERYFGALQPQRPHACFSITKSYAATLAATLLHERILDEGKTVSYYLPEMAGTAYQDATLREVLDIQVGVEYSGDYANPQGHIWGYS